MAPRPPVQWRLLWPATGGFCLFHHSSCSSSLHAVTPFLLSPPLSTPSRTTWMNSLIMSCSSASLPFPEPTRLRPSRSTDETDMASDRCGASPVSSQGWHQFGSLVVFLAWPRSRTRRFQPRLGQSRRQETPGKRCKVGQVQARGAGIASQLDNGPSPATLQQLSPGGPAF